jgi:hypothetical protein
VVEWGCGGSSSSNHLMLDMQHALGHCNLSEVRHGWRGTPQLILCSQLDGIQLARSMAGVDWRELTGYTSRLTCLASKPHAVLIDVVCVQPHSCVS